MQNFAGLFLHFFALIFIFPLHFCGPHLQFCPLLTRQHFPLFLGIVFLIWGPLENKRFAVKSLGLSHWWPWVFFSWLWVKLLLGLRPRCPSRALKLRLRYVNHAGSKPSRIRSLAPEWFRNSWNVIINTNSINQSSHQSGCYTASEEFYWNWVSWSPLFLCKIH